MSMQAFRTHVFPLVRPLAIKWGALLLLLALAWGALWGAQRVLQADWQQAQSQAQAAQAQWDEAQAEQDDLTTHRSRFEQLKAAGLVGGDPRAAWVDDLLRTARDQGLQERLGFTLAPPETLAVAEADAANAQVRRHVLEYSLNRVHDIEALQFMQRFHQDHALMARPMACGLELPTPEGLTARCRVNFLHIDPADGAGNNVKP
jgi:hypothetical protein